jgi:beta-xylosidase
MALARFKPTHLNPVSPGYFADPFVFQFQGTYYAIGTGAHEASGTMLDQVFPMLQSTDLFHWSSAGRAMRRPDPGLGTNFWAPEIAWAEGKFYLYYSVGFSDKNHQLRVACSEQPLGPYTDLGKSLIAPDCCSFAIDPHPFQDSDGRWFLFYARDFLDDAADVCAGTGLMVAAMRNMTELIDEGRIVLRARHPWQRFEKNRLLYGRRWDWHTLEGPCVRKQEEKYYCFFSAGRWENETYGVDYAVADSVMGPYSDAGNESGPRVLRTVPNQVLGPGHNSIVVGPDGATDYIVYHAWDSGMTARRMFVDRLNWTAEGPRCDGPTWRE